MGKGGKKRGRKGDARLQPFDGPVEFVAPVEDPNCPVCQLSPQERLILLLSARDYGETTLVDEHGESHRMVLTARGEGGMTEFLASMRKRAKDADGTEI